MIVSIGSFVLKQRNKLPEFLELSKAILQQAKLSNGNIKAELNNEGIKKFYSFTHWKDSESMLEFVHKDFHLEALEKTKNLCHEACFLHFKSENIIDLNTAIKELNSNKKTRVINFK